MPLYAYRCDDCQTEVTSLVRDNTLGPHAELEQDPDPDCDGLMKRQWSLAIHRPMPDHFNPTVNKMVGSQREFDEDLKKLSDDYTERTGIESRFVSHGPGDAESLGVTTEGLPPGADLR